MFVVLRRGGAVSVGRRRGQVAVLDRGLAGVLAAAGLVGLCGVFFAFRNSSMGSDDYAVVQSVIHEVEAISSRYSTYDGIDTAYVIRRGHIPAWMVQNNVIRIGSHGYLTVSAYGASPTSKFAITASMLPSSYCVHLALMPFDDRQSSVAINGATMAIPLSIPAVETACNTYPTAGIMWILG